MVTIHRRDDMARGTAKQISDLNTAKSEPRLAEGGQTLVAALEEFQPVMTEVQAWMTAHDVDTPSWEVVGRSNGIIKLIFPGIAPAAKPLTSVEKSSGFMKDSSINAHLDAAIAAAESVKSGNNVLYSDRVIMHAKELAELLKNHSRVEGQLEPRIKKLIGLVDQILVKNPYLKRSFDEIEPIRSVKWRRTGALVRRGRVLVIANLESGRGSDETADRGARGAGRTDASSRRAVRSRVSQPGSATP
jgi:hypothetical protein